MFLFNIDLIPVDFNKSWWRVLLARLPFYIVIIAGQVIVNSLGVLTPMWWAQSFAQADFSLFVQVFMIWISMVGVDYAIRRMYTCFQVAIINSVHYSAYSKLFSVDPLYHAYKSQGALFSKIDRGAQGYRDLLDAFTFGIFPTIVRTITVLWSLTKYTSSLALLIAGSLLAVIIVNALFHLVILRPREIKLINAQDTLKDAALGSVPHIQLIRSAFASGQVLALLKSLAQRLLKEEEKFWNIHAALYSIIYLLYLTTVLILAGYLFSLMGANALSGIIAVALLGIYIRGTNGILKLERPVRILIKSVIGLQDCFNYIKSFGLQTFPVLTKDDHTKFSLVDLKLSNLERSCGDITISLTNLTFSYNSRLNIFNKQNLCLQVPGTQTNKLYGIRGFSGSGKSTFSAIIGGQLKPISGTVNINNQDIYSLTEEERKNFVALQSQTNSLLQRSLKNNLLLGLPLNSYSDEKLIKILKEEQLWDMFNSEHGLETLIGENGFTLSGGQRQIIRFINLYLRVLYFKPKVIILDEPTSHLDSCHERKIMERVYQMACTSVIFLVSHKTELFSSAYAVADFSFNQDKSWLVFEPLNNNINRFQKASVTL